VIVLASIQAVVTLWLAVYGLHAFIIAFLYLRQRKAKPIVSQQFDDADLPRVTLQVPLYNERYVVKRVIDAVAAVDYPRDRLQIQILDDSTDETTHDAEICVAHHRALGIDITVLRRPERDGFKAGALAWAAPQARGELIAIFDADFQPRTDFLRRTVPHFLTNPHLGMVQTRWSYLNADYSPLTRAQTMALDGHFAVEQVARNRSGLLINFNGTGGIWRRECIQAAGGWVHDTLAEDLDLSYRAQLAGWEFLYLRDVDAPAELPPQMAAYKRQQARWAQGSVQCLRKLSGPILHSSRLSWPQKLMGLLHLSNYLAHPLMILVLLITLPLVLWPNLARVSLGGLGLMCFGPPLVYALSQKALYANWWRRMGAFPLLALIGVGIAWNNTCAIWRGLTQWGGDFARTPKFQLEGKRGDWENSSYRLRIDASTGGEIVLALYALTAAIVAVLTGQTEMAPFMLFYVAGFGTVAGMDVAQTIRAGRERRREHSPQKSHEL